MIGRWLQGSGITRLSLIIRVRRGPGQRRVVISIRVILGGGSDRGREGIIGRDSSVWSDGGGGGTREIVVILWSELLDSSRVEQTLGLGVIGGRGSADASWGEHGSAGSLGGQRGLLRGLGGQARGCEGGGVPVEGLLGVVGAAAWVAIPRVVMVEAAACIFITAFAIYQDILARGVSVC